MIPALWALSLGLGQGSDLLNVPANNHYLFSFLGNATDNLLTLTARVSTFGTDESDLLFLL